MKVFVYGPPGAGKTTLALRLGEASRIAVHHLDIHFHRGPDDHVPIDEAMAGLVAVIDGADWIVEGNHAAALAACATAADHVVVLDVNRFVGLARMVRRRFGRLDAASRATSSSGVPRLPWHLVWFALVTHPRMSPGNMAVIRRNARRRPLALGQAAAWAFRATDLG